jgi:hypothetical protein
MSRFRDKLAGAALLVAIAAVVLAATGTGIALPGKHTVSSGDIKPGAVKSKQIKDGKVRPQDLANKTRMWARVSGDGNLVSASKGNVTTERTNEGVYAVDFNANDLSLCAWIVQISSFVPGGDIPSGEVTAEIAASANDTVRVGTHDHIGDPKNHGFTLIVFC